MTAIRTATHHPVRSFAPAILGLLGVACLASWLLVIVLGSKLTFFNDDWYFLLQRPGLESHGGLDTLLAPHNSNLVVLTAASYKVLVALFGLGSQLPFRIVLGATIAAVGLLVFLLVARRAGQLVALACALVVLFLGAAWEDLLFYGAAIDIAGSMATGLAALWLLERGDRRLERSDRRLERGDRRIDRSGARPYLVCLLLICSVGFSNVGVPFALGVATQLLLRRRPAQVWVVVVPLALFGLWWALDGSGQPSHLSAHNIMHLPKYVLDSIASGLASLTGLHGGTASGMRLPGRIVLGVVAVATVLALWRGWRPHASVLVPVVTALAFWCLTGAGYYAGREPFASRYQLIDAVLLILIGADLLGMVRPGMMASAAIGLVALGIVSSNIADRLVYGYRFLRTQSGFVKADLGALQLGRHLAPQNLWLLEDVAHNPYLSGVTAGRFFAETRAHGRVPTYSVAQIATAPEPERQGADHVLALAERLPPQKIGSGLAGRCARLGTGSSGTSHELAIGPGIWILTEPRGAGLGIGVRRFAPPRMPSYIGLIAPGLHERMAVPQDGIPARWRLSIKAADPSRTSILRLCEA